MFYDVKTQLPKEMAADLRRALLDDTIRNQAPDGQEVGDSMQRAVMTVDGCQQHIGRRLLECLDGLAAG